MIQKPKRHGRKVEIYVDKPVDRLVRRIAKKSKRAISDVANELARLTWSKPDVVDILQNTVFLTKGRWCERRLYSRLSNAMYDDLKDLAWLANIRGLRGTESAVGYVMGVLVKHQLDTQPTEHWIQYFKKCEDVCQRIVNQTPQEIK